jgi:hypothetical protein
MVPTNQLGLQKEQGDINKSAKLTRRLRNLMLCGVSQLQHAYAFCSSLLFFNVIYYTLVI